MIGACKGIFVTLLLSLVGHTLLAIPPVHYVENKNQWPDEFRFGADFPQMKVFLKDASIFFVQHSLIPENGKSPKTFAINPLNESHPHRTGELSIATFELAFIDALKPSITTSEKHPTTYNYFNGNDPSKWTSKATAFGEVLYSGMYGGVDLKVYSEGDQMKYDWIISPCADARRVRFTCKGVEHIEIRNEDLVIESKLGEVIETKPYAYQIVNGHKRAVTAMFEIDDDVVSFVFPEGYDSNYELIIDPALIFSSYSGSALDNWGNTATFDSKGNLYSGGIVSGQFNQVGFPTTAGAFQTKHANGSEWDIGILKYDSSGANLMYVTYLGGTGAETPQSFVVNENDELLVLGATSSPDFPGTTGNFKGGETIDPIAGILYDGGTDIFVAKFSADGSMLLHGTYLGGSGNDGINFVSGELLDDHIESVLGKNYGDQLRGDILTDAAGNVYISTTTASLDFPVVNSDPNANYHGGTHDAVVAMLASDLSVVWTRLLGGDSTDAAYSIKLTDSGNVVAAGGTASINLVGMNGQITAAPGQIDGWIAILSPDGSQIINETYVGTNAYDQVYFIDVASNGDVVAYGQTKGHYPVSPGVYSNPNSGQFIHRFTADLKSTVFSTVFGTGGRSPNISPTAFLVSACDNIYVAGWGGSINSPDYWGGDANYVGGDTFGLPVTADAFQRNTSGHDFYLAVLSANAKELLYGTFLGGPTSPTHVDGGTSRFDKRGIVYHAVCASCFGNRNDFPAYNVPPSRSRSGSTRCNNAAFKFDLSSLHAQLQTNNISFTAPGIRNICIPDTIVFQNLGIGGERYEWNFGDGPTQIVVNKDPIPHQYKKPGKYLVKLKAFDRSTCAAVDSTQTIINVFVPDMHAGPDQNICFGSSTNLDATGAASYSWTSTDKRFSSDIKQPPVSPEDTTLYILNMIDADGCTRTDSLQVNVIPSIDLSFDFEKVYDCQNRPYLKVKSTSKLKPDEDVAFFFGDGQSSNEMETTHSYELDGVYSVTLRGTKDVCAYQVSREIPIITLQIPNVITPGEEDGLNDTFRIRYGDPAVLTSDAKIGLKIMDRWGVNVYESKDYRNDWKGADLDEGVYYFEANVLGEVQCKGWVHLIK